MGFISDKKRVAWLSVASNTLLTAGKLLAGILTGSVSILSEAAHSALDLIAAGMATFSVHAADRPPDQGHPYGHEKIENVSGVVEGLLIFIAAAWIINEAADKLLHGVHLRDLGNGIIVMAFSAIINFIVATLLRRSAIANRSVALEADAAHLYTDVYTSVGVFVGLFIIMVGKRFFRLDLAWLDPLIAIGVALLILSTAYRITRKSFLPLMDSSASAADVTKIKAIMDEFRSRGLDFHNLRTRGAGGSLHVDLHMGVGPGVSLEEGHQVSHELKSKIEETVAGAKVLVHLEPSNAIITLPESDEQVKCMRDELLKDSRVHEICDLKAARYHGDLRIEADLRLDPKVTLAESRAVASDLKNHLESCFPEVKETILSMHPGDGWQSAFHEDDLERIRSLVGEHQARYASIHGLKVVSSGGVHRVHLTLGVSPALPVTEAHAVGRHLEEDIRRLFPEGAEIDLHTEPCNGACETCYAVCPERKAK
jgi:cation diffusion facilitator family transporter